MLSCCWSISYLFTQESKSIVSFILVPSQIIQRSVSQSKNISQAHQLMCHSKENALEKFIYVIVDDHAFKDITNTSTYTWENDKLIICLNFINVCIQNAKFFS